MQEWKMGKVEPFPCAFHQGFVPGIAVCALVRAVDYTQACQAEPELVGDWTHQDPAAFCALGDMARLSSVHVSKSGLALLLFTRVLAAEWMAKDKSH